MKADTIPASKMDCETIKLGDKNRPKYEKLLKQRRLEVPEESEAELIAQHKVLFVSFYTPDYEEAAQRLLETLTSLGLPHDLVSVEKPPGDVKTSWYDSETDKASFLIQMLEKHPDYETLVWLDADGEMIRFPRLLWNIPTVLGVHYHGFKEPTTSTVAVRRESIPMLEMWAKESKIAFKARQKCPSQKALKVVLSKAGIEWAQLPMAYALLWRWNSRDKAEANGVFIHERWNRNAKEPTKDKNGKRIKPRKSKRKDALKR